jgi:hypothetical protein
MSYLDEPMSRLDERIDAETKVSDYGREYGLSALIKLVGDFASDYGEVEAEIACEKNPAVDYDIMTAFYTSISNDLHAIAERVKNGEKRLAMQFNNVLELPE